MKTCEHCGRQYSDAREFCVYCDLKLSSGASSEVITHINYLLAELRTWTEIGWVTDRQAENLRHEYEERRNSLLFPKAEPLREKSRPITPSQVPNESVPSPKPASQTHWMSALLEQQNISYWHLVGSILLIAGLIGLVHWTWATVGKYLVFGLMLALTGGLTALARSRALSESQITRTGLLAISALLVPLDVIAANVFHLMGLHWNGNQVGFASALISFPLLLWLARSERAKCFTIMLAANTAAMTHFALQLLLPELLGTHDLGRIYGAYGWFLLPIAFGYFLLAKRVKDENHRQIWLTGGHAMALTALTLTVSTDAATAIGVVAAHLVLSACIYACAAWLLETRALVYLSCTYAILAGVTTLGWRHIDFEAYWYVFVLVSQAISFVFFLANRSFRALQKPDLASAYHESALAVTGLGVVAHVCAALIGAQAVFGLHSSLPTLIGTTVSVSLLIIVFDRIMLRPIGDALTVYVTVLSGLISAYTVPANWEWHTHPHIGLLLVIASGVLRWGRRQEISSIICGFFALAGCAIAALVGISTVMTSLALVLLLGFWLTSARTYTFALGAILTTTVLTLQQEHLLLPILHHRYGWEENYGIGLFALTSLLAAFAWLRKSLRIDDQIAQLLQQSAITLGIANAALQLFEAMTSEFLYSPTILLTLGILFCVGIAYWRRSNKAADASVLLTPLAYFATLVYVNFSEIVDRRSELLTIMLLCISAVCFLVLSLRLRYKRTVYALAFTSVLAFVQIVHWYWNPALTVYALALFPWIAVLLAVGHFQTRRDASEIWGRPLYRSGLILTAFALAPVMIGIGYQETPEDRLRIVLALGLYGLLSGVFAIVRRSIRQSYVACGLINVAIVFVLMHQTPRLMESVLGFAISLVGLMMLAVSVTLSLKKSDMEYAISPLSHTAAALAMIAIVCSLESITGPSNKFSVYALLVAGTIFLGNAALSRNSAWQHIGMVTYLTAYSAFLMDHIGAPKMSQSDFYLIPVGLYVLGLGLIAKRRSEQANAHPYYFGGLLLILTPTFVAAWNTAGSPLHPLLLATECVATIFWGLASRIKIILGTGAVFLAALIELETQGTLTHLHWAIYATALGLAIIGSAIFFEKRRNDVLRWGQTIQDNLRDWD